MSKRVLVLLVAVAVFALALPGAAFASRIAYPPVAFDDTVSQSLQTFVAGDRTAGAAFGYSIAVSGSTAVVGARHYYTGLPTPGPGAAYVFSLVGGVWTQTAKLTASDAAMGDRFGSSVAIEGGTILVGAPYDDDMGANSGSVYVFTGAGSSWAQQAKLTAVDGAIDDLFGCSVSLSSGTAVIGAYADDADTGSAYVFTGSAATWTQRAKLLDTAGAAGNRFGRSVAVSGGTIMVGAPGLDAPRSATYTGKVCVFTGSGATWAQGSNLAVPGVVAGDRFGGTLLLSPTQAVVGAWGDLSVSGYGTVLPAFYTFTKSGSAWPMTSKTTAADGPIASFFGTSVTLSGGFTFVGLDWADAMNFKGLVAVYGPKVPLATLMSTALSVAAPGVLVNDYDPQFLTLTATVTVPPAHGTVTMYGNGAFVYTPVTGYVGTDTFTYKAWNGYLYSNAAVVTISVTPVTMATPVSPYKVRRNRLFRVYGNTPGRHTPGTYPVVLDCYRNEGGTWVWHKSVAMKAYKYPNRKKYARYFRLPLKGHWRLIARHMENGYPQYSEPRFMNVR